MATLAVRLDRYAGEVWHLDNGRDGEIYAKRDPGPSGDRDGGRGTKDSHLQGRGGGAFSLSHCFYCWENGIVAAARHLQPSSVGLLRVCCQCYDGQCECIRTNSPQGNEHAELLEPEIRHDQADTGTL